MYSVIAKDSKPYSNKGYFKTIGQVLKNAREFLLVKQGLKRLRNSAASSGSKRNAGFVRRSAFRLAAPTSTEARSPSAFLQTKALDSGPLGKSSANLASHRNIRAPHSALKAEYKVKQRSQPPFSMFYFAAARQSPCAAWRPAGRKARLRSVTVRVLLEKSSSFRQNAPP